MNRRFFSGTLFGLLAAAPATAAPTPSAKTHRLATQIDSDDKRSQQLVLGNVRNYATHYREKGEPFEVRVVAFGPGYGLVRADQSTLAGPIAALQKDLGSALTILACENTRHMLAASEGKKPEDILLLPGIETTPSGIVALAELQEAGWAYVRP